MVTLFYGIENAQGHNTTIYQKTVCVSTRKDPEKVNKTIIYRLVLQFCCRFL